MKLVDRRVHIDAAVEDVYELLTDAGRFVAWMAPTATLDPKPGGVVTWTHLNGDVVSGQYVKIVPNRRVVFTFGWERADVEVPPGSTTVEIDLRATTTGTELHLVHRRDTHRNEHREHAGKSRPLADQWLRSIDHGEVAAVSTRNSWRPRTTTTSLAPPRKATSPVNTTLTP